jgi:hypothetical protein
VVFIRLLFYLIQPSAKGEEKSINRIFRISRIWGREESQQGGCKELCVNGSNIINSTGLQNG